MAEDHIRYDVLTQDALRGVVRKVLSEVAKAGLPGEHHFFISFATRAPGVRISKKLLDQYEEEMTIVVQNQFWDLKTSETGFEIGLSFDGINEILVIPFSALKGFFDPSVQFGLQFDVANSSNSTKEAPLEAEITAIGGEKDDKKATSTAKSDRPASSSSSSSSSSKTNDAAEPDNDKPAEKVVSLDSFRKKP